MIFPKPVFRKDVIGEVISLQTLSSVSCVSMTFSDKSMTFPENLENQAWKLLETCLRNSHRKSVGSSTLK